MSQAQVNGASAVPAATTEKGGEAVQKRLPVSAFSRALDLDPRMLGLLLGVAVIWVTMDIASGGVFLTPRNLWNLAVQSSATAIIAMGMVLVIVTRNIDLSVGSLLAFVGLSGALVQQNLLGLGDANTWWLALGLMIVLGAVCGALQGGIIAYLKVPAFVVTLGGLLFWRGAAYELSDGRTVTPVDDSFYLLGSGSIGASWSWFVGLAGCVAITLFLLWRRRVRRRYGFAVKSLPLTCVSLAVWCAIILVTVGVLNGYNYPGSEQARGIPLPVLLLIGLAVVMIYVARITRFGRYVYAIGGNPEASRLAGLNVNAVTVGVFAITGALTGVAAAVMTARLNSAPLSMGELLELQVIAAAVIGGTSLGGGIGTVFGAIIGAVLMQSLTNGLVLLGAQSSTQMMVLGGVLVLAVWFDVLYRRTQR